MNRALIIVAHGSSVNPASAETVIEHAAALRLRPEIRRHFDRIEARFLKQPAFLAETDFTNAVIIPFFMADGYFTREVLPRFIPPATIVTPPLGDADLSALIRDTAHAIDPDAHLVLAGHGTERSPNSGATLERIAAALRSDFPSVRVGFIDQSPPLNVALRAIADDGRAIITLPFFAIAGPHTEFDIPEALGLSSSRPGPHVIDGRLVHYAPPVGVLPEIVHVLERMALDALDYSK